MPRAARKQVEFPNPWFMKDGTEVSMPVKAMRIDMQVFIGDYADEVGLDEVTKVLVKVGPYDDFKKWATEMQPDWDRYAWNGAKYAVENLGASEKLLDHYDSPLGKSLYPKGWTYETLTDVGFKEYVRSLAESMEKGDVNAPLIRIHGEPADGRHRTLAAMMLGWPVAPIMDLEESE